MFAWNEAEKSAVLSSFFGGYGLLQIVAGRMAERYGSKLILTAGMGLSAVSTVVVPYAAQNGYLVVCALRVLQGAVQVISKSQLEYVAGILGQSDSSTPIVGDFLSQYNGSAVEVDSAFRT